MIVFNLFKPYSLLVDTYLPLLSIRSFANRQQNHEKIKLHMMFLSLLPNVPQTMEPNGYKVEDTTSSKLAHKDIYKLGNNNKFINGVRNGLHQMGCILWLHSQTIICICKQTIIPNNSQIGLQISNSGGLGPLNIV